MQRDSDFLSSDNAEAKINRYFNLSCQVLLNEFETSPNLYVLKALARRLVEENQINMWSFNILSACHDDKSAKKFLNREDSDLEGFLPHLAKLILSHPLAEQIKLVKGFLSFYNLFMYFENDGEWESNNKDKKTRRRVFRYDLLFIARWDPNTYNSDYLSKHIDATGRTHNLLATDYLLFEGTQEFQDRRLALLKHDIDKLVIAARCFYHFLYFCITESLNKHKKHFAFVVLSEENDNHKHEFDELLSKRFVYKRKGLPALKWFTDALTNTLENAPFGDQVQIITATLAIYNIYRYLHKMVTVPIFAIDRYWSEDVRQFIFMWDLFKITQRVRNREELTTHFAESAAAHNLGKTDYFFFEGTSAFQILRYKLVHLFELDKLIIASKCFLNGMRSHALSNEQENLSIVLIQQLPDKDIASSHLPQVNVEEKDEDESSEDLKL